MASHAPRRRRGGAYRLLLLAGLAVGCASAQGLPLSELPADPIALVYWDPETARRRLEAIEQLTGPEPGRPGVARIESVAELLGADGGRRREVLARFPGRIALLDPQTLELSELTASPVGSRPLAWSDDHRKLLFASAHLGRRFQLYVYDRQTREVHPLTHGDRHHLEADWGPEGGLVYSWIERRGAQSLTGLELVGQGGGQPLRILDGAYASSPRWSPRGDLLVYVQAESRPSRSASARDQSAIVVQAPSPGADARVLTRGREPVFSPDGEWIVYTAQTRDGWRLRRMRSDGSARAGVGGGNIRDERNPAVSPDGRFLAYVAQEAGIDRLFVRRMDGSGDRILFGDGGVADPVW